MQNIGFSDSGYVIKPPQPSSAIDGAPSFSEYLKIAVSTCSSQPHGAKYICYVTNAFC